MLVDDRNGCISNENFTKSVLSAYPSANFDINKFPELFSYRFVHKKNMNDSAIKNNLC